MPNIVFKRWSRKNYGILISLSSVVKIGVLSFAYSLANRGNVLIAQTDSSVYLNNITQINEVEIATHRNEAVFSDPARLVTVIRRKEIEAAGLSTFADIVNFASNADIRQRGQMGIQSDITIRGGTFDHVMILVNGVNITDPQTGHASLDFPLDPESIDRIEILEGSAARILGGEAFAGAVNIITRKGIENAVSVHQQVGEHGFWRTNLTGSLRLRNMRQFFSATHAASKGYGPDTDFGISDFYYHLNGAFDESSLDFQFGLQNKHFGAAGFYSPRFPDQYEANGLWFTSLRASFGNRIKFSPLVYWRHRWDHYILERQNPAFYQNFHLTDVIGSQFNMAWQTHKVITTIGVDIRSENILSNNLGYPRSNPIRVKGQDSIFYDHQYGRTNIGYFQEHSFNLGHFHISGGMMINWNSAYPEKPSVFPGLDVSYPFMQGFRAYISVNRALHLPTFTDLFYTDPSNQGNLRLVPNKMISYEGGLQLAKQGIRGNLVYFGANGKNLIDWLWTYSGQKFSPVNLDHCLISGIESQIALDFSERSSVGNILRRISVGYMHLNIRKSLPDSVSKYYQIKNKWIFQLQHQIVRNVSAFWNVTYQDRAGMLIGYDTSDNTYYGKAYRPFWILDGTLTWSKRPVKLYVSVSNLLNTKYTDAGSAVQPDRWFKAGLLVNLGSKMEP